jgi:hypothetical protein
MLSLPESVLESVDFCGFASYLDLHFVDFVVKAGYFLLVAVLTLRVRLLVLDEYFHLAFESDDFFVELEVLRN